jgi:hypothetical protein
MLAHYAASQPASTCPTSTRFYAAVHPQDGGHAAGAFDISSLKKKVGGGRGGHQRTSPAGLLGAAAAAATGTRKVAKDAPKGKAVRRWARRLTPSGVGLAR